MMPAAAFLGQFGQAVDFIFHERESRAGGFQVGGSQFLDLAGKHMELSLVAVGIACAIAIPLGLALGHTGRGSFLAINITNVGRAVPSLALIALFIAFLGVGFVNVTAALVLLALPPILTNTYVGVRQVDRDTADAARGMGMGSLRMIAAVELPLALPTVFAGLRTSAVNVVATATIAPLGGVVTLGDPIINVSGYGEAGRLGAAILVALLAIATDLVLAAVQRGVTPRGVKLERGTSPRQRRRFVHNRRVEATR